MSNITYGSGDGDTFSYSSSTGMETGFTLNQSTNNITSALTWFPTGVLQQQQFTDTVTPASAHTCVYGYDDLARLTSDNCGSTWSQTYSYDQFGNIVKSGNNPFTGTYNNKNQLTNLSATYDASGNMLTINNGSVQTYTWDAENRIAVINGKTIVYDALDRAIEEGTTLQILYSPVGKLGTQSGQVNQSVRIGLPKGALAVYDINRTTEYFVHPDLLGNGILGTNRGKGKVFDRFFAPFGEVYNNHTYSGTSSVVDFAGITQDLDPSLYDAAAREQSPVQGRWLNPDPSGMSAVIMSDPQTLNRYSYVRNSAMSLNDPSGLRPPGVDAFYAGVPNYGGAGGIGTDYFSDVGDKDDEDAKDDEASSTATTDSGEAPSAQDQSQTQTQTQTQKQQSLTPQTVVTPASDTTGWSHQAPGVKERDIVYVPGTMDSSGNFSRDSSRTVTLSEKQTEGNSKPDICTPCTGKGGIEDGIAVRNTKSWFTVEQHFSVDKKPVNVLWLDKAGKPALASMQIVHATATEITVTRVP